jgi:hypothetical protein
MIYEVAILKTAKIHPTNPALDEKEEIILEPFCVLAKDNQSAAIQAVMMQSATLFGIDRTRLQVLTRPFV